MDGMCNILYDVRVESIRYRFSPYQFSIIVIMEMGFFEVFHRDLPEKLKRMCSNFHKSTDS